MLNAIATKMCSYPLLFLVVFCEIVSARDFYAGMFRIDDYLVAQDRLYKEKVPFRSTIAKYGRYFKCQITYFRVVDRLGVGGGPHVLVTRGGLRKKFITLRLTSPYNLPISVNIYVGCANYEYKKKVTKTTTIATTVEAGNETSASPGGDVTTSAGGNGTTVPEGDVTTAPGVDVTTPTGGTETTKVAGDETTPTSVTETTIT